MKPLMSWMQNAWWLVIMRKFLLKIQPSDTSRENTPKICGGCCACPKKGKDFRIEYRDIEETEGVGKAHWEAFYTFRPTKRKVHNKIDARFEFQDGKIIRHVDTFNLYRWTKQAFGLQGLLFGWTDIFKQRLNLQTNKMLTMFEEKISKS